MEVKKSPKADLERYKVIFTQIGFILSLLLILGMLSVTKGEVEIEIIETEEIVAEAEVTELVRPEEPPKPAVTKVFAPTITDVFEVVDNETELEEDQDIFDADANEDKAINIYNLPTGVETDGELYIPDDDAPVVRAEKMPIFEGRPFQEFNKWVQKKVKYPQLASENGIQGVVVVQFVVGKDGMLKDFKVLAQPDRSLGDEVIRVLKSAPKCEPGEQRGRPVSILATVRVVFRTQ